MTNYKLKSGDVTVAADATELDDAMKEADEWCSYNNQSLEILEDGKVVATRSWYGCTEGFEDEENPIGFGNFGYYADWVIND